MPILETLLVVIAAVARPEAEFAPGRPAALAALSFLPGEWQVRGRERGEPGEAWRELRGECSVREVLGGVGLEETCRLEGEPGATLALWSFDRLQQCFRAAWLDDVAGLVDVYEGRFDGEELRLDNLASNTFTRLAAAPGRAVRRRHGRVRLASSDDRRFRLDRDSSPDGGANWYRTRELEYVRRRAAAPTATAAASVHAEATAPPLAALAGLVGRWEITGEAVPAPGAPWVRVSGHATIRAVLGGLGLVDESRLVEGAPLATLTLRAFDPFQRLFRTVVLDDYTGILDVYAGSAHDGELSVSNTATGTYFPADPRTGEGRAWARARLHGLAAGRFGLEWEISYDRGASWLTIARLAYEREGR